MNRSSGKNNNARIVEKFCPLEYIHPTNPADSFQVVDNLKIRQNYGPINSTHFPEMIYHNVNAKIRMFPTRKMLRNQKDQHPKYDDRAKIGKEMYDHMRISDNSGVHSGWKGYETLPERNILENGHAVKSLTNVRFSSDPCVSIFDDIKTFFTRYGENGREVDEEMLECFSDLQGIYVQKDLPENKLMFKDPAEFIRQLRYDIFHGDNNFAESSNNFSANATSLPISADNSSSAARSEPIIENVTSEASSAEADRVMRENHFNDRIMNLEDQISDLKEDLFFEEEKVNELTSVISAVLEVTKTSLEANNSKLSEDIVVYDRIYNFKSGIRAQIYKIRNNNKSKKELCGCFQCELQKVCTLTHKILKTGLENCVIDPKKFAFGKNVDGQICEPTESCPRKIELSEITSENKIGSQKESIIDEQVAVSVFIDSHDSRDQEGRSVKINQNHSTPIKSNTKAPKILINADIDNSAEITRPDNPNSEGTSQQNWSNIVSSHEKFKLPHEDVWHSSDNES